MNENTAAGVISSQFMKSYMNGQNEVKNADRDVKEMLSLEKGRLKNFGLDLKKEYTERGLMASGSDVRIKHSRHYVHTTNVKTTSAETTVSRDGKKLYGKKENESFYTYVTDSLNYTEDGTTPYCCPNCGAVSTVNELQEGCSYCGTRFRISELFPKVSYYFSQYDPSATEGELKKDILKNMLIVFGIELVLLLFILFNGGNIIEFIFQLFLAVVIAVLLGYSIWAFKKLGKLFFEAGRSVTMLPMLKSMNEFKKKMKEIDPDFDMDYFVFKTVSYVRMIMFSDDNTLLPFFKGKKVDRYTDVLDAAFRGGIKFRKYEIKDGVLKLDMDLFMSCLHYVNGKVIKRDDTVLLKMEKDLSIPTDYDFSISQFKCKNCGGSYNGYKETKCPYCGSEIEVSAYDWTITDID
ncbi:MAG: hypothetical protein MJ171_05385 [Clostridia bacterium]|nr:hypothetical protein [Clostridia bacterium]